MKTKNEKFIKITAIFILSWLGYFTGYKALAAESPETLVMRVLNPYPTRCSQAACGDGRGRPQADGSCRPCNVCSVPSFYVMENKWSFPAKFLSKEPDVCNYIKDDCSVPINCEVQLEAKGYFTDTFFIVEEWQVIKP